MIGPINLFFKFQEGKTNFDQLLEDYAEGRNLPQQMVANQNRGPVLPDTNHPVRRRNINSSQ